MKTFARKPARETTIEDTIGTLVQGMQQLMQLHAETNPLLKPSIDKLGQALQAQLIQSQLQGQELVLKGHGPKGAELSTSIETEAGEEAFLAKLPQTVETPVDPQIVMELLGRYFGAHVPQSGVPQSGWIVPSAEFSQLVKELPEDSVLEDLEPGIYLLHNPENPEQHSFQMVLHVDSGTDKPHLLLFSPSNGLQIATYVEMEESWVHHQSWAYVADEAVEKTLSELTNTISVQAWPAEQIGPVFKQALGKTDPQALSQLQGVTVGDDSIEISVSQAFRFFYNTKTQTFKVIELADGMHWGDMPYPYQSSVVQMVLEGITQIATAYGLAQKEGKVPAKKAAAKKVAKS